MEQAAFRFVGGDLRADDEVRADALALFGMWKDGNLGGEVMPEDVHPQISNTSTALLHYFTLGMCLNYQRNSYKLWEACTKCFLDEKSAWVFDPGVVASADIELVRSSLVGHRVALQPNKHTENWVRVSTGIVKHGSGDMNRILQKCDYDIEVIREYIQSNRKDFPYLAGDKICNYWLFVLTQYCSYPFINRSKLSIAPDTHVVNASVQLGLIEGFQNISPQVQSKCSEAWGRILRETDMVPIDLHTPLWLWSRAGFPRIVRHL